MADPPCVSAACAIVPAYLLQWSAWRGSLPWGAWRGRCAELGGSPPCVSAMCATVPADLIPRPAQRSGRAQLAGPPPAAASTIVSTYLFPRLTRHGGESVLSPTDLLPHGGLHVVSADLLPLSSRHGGRTQLGGPSPTQRCTQSSPWISFRSRLGAEGVLSSTDLPPGGGMRERPPRPPSRIGGRARSGGPPPACRRRKYGVGNMFPADRRARLVWQTFPPRVGVGAIVPVDWRVCSVW